VTRLALALLALGLFVSPAAEAATLPADSTAILSGQPSLLGQLPAPRNLSFANDDSVSTDGRFVAFQSNSDGLSAEDDDNVINVYVKDRVTGTVTFVSRATGANGAPTSRDSFEPAISDDGTHVAFVTSDSLDPADGNDHGDVYVRDLVHNTTELVSRATGADGAAANQFADDPSLSADGTRVAFETAATNLSGTAQPAVYVRNLQADTTTLVSLADNETLPNGDSAAPSISNDGNLVAFSSRASNLVSGDNNGVSDVFVRNISGGTTDLVSRASGGAIGNGDSFTPSISGNGNVVAFESNATNLDARDTTNGPDVYKRTGTTTELLDRVGDTKGTVAAFDPELNDDGTVAIFRSQATNLDPSVTGDITDAIYVAKGGTIEAASRATGALGAPAHEVLEASVSGDGTEVLFGWLGQGVLPGDDAFVEAAALREVDQHTTSPVAVPPGATTFTNGGDFGVDGALSADGRYAAFVTGSTALGVPAAAREEVVVRDTVTGTTELASREDGPGGAPMTGRLNDPAISANGRRVAFQRETDAGKEEIWLRDLDTGRTVRVDARPDGTPANGNSEAPSIDASGLRVEFLSRATNLDPADTLNGEDAYVRDFAANTTSLVSRTVAGARSNGATQAAQISGNGDHVVFESNATNLGDGDSDNSDDIHIRDLSAGTTRLVSVSSGGVKSNGSSDQASISFDGSRVAFSSTGDNLGAPMTDHEQIYLRDLAAGTTALVSRFNGAGDVGDGDSFDPRISADGQVVAFDSTSTNLVPGVPEDTTETYRRDLVSGSTELVSRAPGPNGAPSSGDTETGGLTANGACIAFDADGNAFEGSPLGRSDFGQVYMRVFKPDCGRPPGTTARDTTPPVLRSVSLSRTRFRVAKAATKISAAKKRKLPGRGTTLRFKSSEAATLSIRIERVLPGRKAGKGRKRTCKPVRHPVKRGRCTAFKRRATLTRSVKAGNGRVALSGRIGKRRMAAGRYRLTLTARDAAGNVSKPVRRSFTIVPG
jgi:Tol biopolymer transport system component